MLAQSKNRAKDVNRLHTWRALFIAAFVLLFLPSGATLLSVGKPKPAGFQQKPPNVRSKKLPGVIDPKSVLAEPSVSTTQQSRPPQRPPPPPPKPPHFQVIPVPASARVGEVVTFTLQPVNLVREYSRRLRFDFGDRSEIKPLEANQLGTSHTYASEGKYEFSVYVGDLKVNDPGIVVVGPWSLGAVPHEIDIGGEVLFAIDNPPKDKAIEYWFHFDDDDSPDAKWTSDSAARHQYHSAGLHQPYAEVRRVTDGSLKPAQTNRLQINVRQLAGTALQLKVVPNDKVQVDKDVTFTATLLSKLDQRDPHLRFNFDFGENGAKRFSGWQPGATATHSYLLAGTYPAKVEVAWLNDLAGPRTPITQSVTHDVLVVPDTQVNPQGNVSPTTPVNPQQGNVSPTTPVIPPGKVPPRWKWYPDIIIPALAVIALAILFVGYQTLKGRFSVKADYQAHRDNGIAQTTGGSLAIEFDIRLKPDVTEAQYQLDAPEAGLIRYERREHD